MNLGKVSSHVKWSFNMFQRRPTNQRQTWPLDFPLFPATGPNTVVAAGTWNNEVDLTQLFWHYMGSMYHSSSVFLTRDLGVSWFPRVGWEGFGGGSTRTSTTTVCCWGFSWEFGIHEMGLPYIESQNTRVQDNPTLKGACGKSLISRCFLTYGGLDNHAFPIITNGKSCIGWMVRRCPLWPKKRAIPWILPPLLLRKSHRCWFHLIFRSM